MTIFILRAKNHKGRTNECRTKEMQTVNERGLNENKSESEKENYLVITMRYTLNSSGMQSECMRWEQHELLSR